MTWPTWILIAICLVLALAVLVGPSRAATGRWVVTLGKPLETETACQVDLASLANVVPARTPLRCMRVEIP